MPAVVRGGRRQGASAAPRRAPQARGGRGGRSAAPQVHGNGAALGKLDLSPRIVALLMALSVGALGIVLATGSRGERIGNSLSGGMNAAIAATGMKLDRVYIEGESPEATRDIQRAVQVPAGQALTSIDLEAVRQRVEAVGWVKSARVSRLFPNSLLIQVQEHDRLAIWQSQGEVHVIDASGQVIPNADPGRYPRLPLVVGVGADQAAAEILPLIAERRRLAGRIEALVRVDDRRWDLRLKDGSLIQLPALHQEAALIQLDEMDHRERLLDLGFSRVDLRTPEAVAVRPASTNLGAN